MTSNGTNEAVPVYRVRVTEMPEDERPRERLRRLGGGALKSEELLAILLHTGTAQEDGTSPRACCTSAAASVDSPRRT